jgi:hypothetical protein
MSEQAAAAQPTPPAVSAPVPPDFSAAGLNTQEVQAFLGTIKQAVAQDGRTGLASLVSYPLTVRIRGRAVVLKKPADFLAHYSEIMTDSVRQAVLRSELAGLFVNYQGVRLGSGELWFAGVYPPGANRYELKIIAINPG